MTTQLSSETRWNIADVGYKSLKLLSSCRSLRIRVDRLIWCLYGRQEEELDTLAACCIQYLDRFTNGAPWSLDAQLWPRTSVRQTEAETATDWVAFLPVCVADPQQSVSGRTGVDFTAADKQHATHSSNQPSSIPTTHTHTHALNMSILIKLAQTSFAEHFFFPFIGHPPHHIKKLSLCYVQTDCTTVCMILLIMF